MLLAWQIIGTLRIYPYYLAFFNEAAGGPDHGRFVLSDSNLDWGQDLPALKTYLDQNKITDFNFSYFGGIDPAVYGIQGYALPPVRAAMHTHGAWWLHRFYPPDPAPGVYAISASNLMGGAWLDQQTFAELREETPVANLGHSILIYNVPARGPAANLSLAGLQIDQIDPETYRLFQTNDVRPRWFDATSSLIAAPGDTWIAIADDQPIGAGVQAAVCRRCADHAHENYRRRSYLCVVSFRSGAAIDWRWRNRPHRSRLNSVRRPSCLGYDLEAGWTACEFDDLLARGR